MCRNVFKMSDTGEFQDRFTAREGRIIPNIGRGFSPGGPGGGGSRRRGRLRRIGSRAAPPEGRPEGRPQARHHTSGRSGSRVRGGRPLAGNIPASGGFEDPPACGRAVGRWPTRLRRESGPAFAGSWERFNAPTNTSDALVSLCARSRWSFFDAAHAKAASTVVAVQRGHVARAEVQVACAGTGA